MPRRAKNQLKAKKTRVSINPILAKQVEELAATRGQSLHEITETLIAQELSDFGIKPYAPPVSGAPRAEAAGHNRDASQAE